MNALTVVMYHYVRPIRDSALPRIKGLELEEFQSQLNIFQRDYSLIGEQELIATMESGLPLPAKAMLLTFDDGYSDHYQYVFPELVKRGLRGSFFIPSEAVLSACLLDVNKIHLILAHLENVEPAVRRLEAMLTEENPGTETLLFLKEYRAAHAVSNRWDPPEVIYFKRMLQHALPEMTRRRILDRLFSEFVGRPEAEVARDFYVSAENLKTMKAAGMSIGGHGASHRWLDKLSPEEQRKEVAASRAFLESPSLGEPGDSLSFSFPNGRYNSVSLEILREQGFKLAFSVVPELCPERRLLQCPLEIPRFDTNQFA